MPSFLALALLLTPALDPDAPPPAPAEEEFEPGWGPGLFAVVPGLIVHGSGHFLAGDTETGLDLLAMEGIGLGTVLGSGLLLFETGASRRIVGPTVAVGIMGVGTFAVSALSDVYGASTGGRDARVGLTLPDLEARFGYMYVRDPQFDYGHFLVPGLEWHLGRFFADTELEVAADDRNYRVRQRLWWRLLGDVARRTSGSELDVETAVAWHDYDADGFQVLTVDLFVSGRYDLRGLSATLAGSFAHAGLGWAVEFYDYDVPGLEFGEDVGELLLARFGWGLYFGDGAGEAMLWYDHRKDGFAAGLGVEGLGGGTAGHFGLSVEHALTGPWSLAADAIVGSAWIGKLSALYRYGDAE